MPMRQQMVRRMQIQAGWLLLDPVIGHVDFGQGQIAGVCHSLGVSGFIESFSIRKGRHKSRECCLSNRR